METNGKNGNKWKQFIFKEKNNIKIKTNNIISIIIINLIIK